MRELLLLLRETALRGTSDSAANLHRHPPGAITQQPVRSFSTLKPAFDDPSSLPMHVRKCDRFCSVLRQSVRINCFEHWQGMALPRNFCDSPLPAVFYIC